MERATTHISRRQASNTRPAILLAEKLGTPLNQFVSINFTLQGVDGEHHLRRIAEKIRARYCRWARTPGKRRGGTPYDGAMIWVLENRVHYGAHLLIHVPPDRLDCFRKDLAAWIKKDTGVALQATTLDVRPVGNVFGLRKYLLKALDPKYCPLYRIQHVPQGTFQAKRFGYTKNLGPTQCRKHGTKKPYRWPEQAAA